MSRKFDSTLLVIEDKDISDRAKKTLGNYLSRRTSAIEEKTEDGVEVKWADASNSLSIQNRPPHYSPPKPNAYPISPTDEKQNVYMNDANDYLYHQVRQERVQLIKDSGTAEFMGDMQDKSRATLQESYESKNNEAGLLVTKMNDMIERGELARSNSVFNSRFSHDTNPKNNPVVYKNEDIRQDAETLVSRTQAYKGLSQLAISHKNASDLTPALMNTSFANSKTLYENDTRSLNSFNEKFKNVMWGDNSYFDKSEVKNIEDTLEAQYVPFYFQDLRTNEILNFHAFVSNISDQYTAEWKDEDSFGRLDPVQIYKGTKRSIGFEFHVISTSEKDFDRMWWTINRLVMMVYPQWSEGQVTTGSFEETQFAFTKPFSQVFSSSPLIRVRIGDLIASNYSRFNLARNFGLGLQGNFNVASDYVKQPVSTNRLDDLLNRLDENVRVSGENIPIVLATTIGFGKNTIKRGTKGVVSDGRRHADGRKILSIILEKTNKKTAVEAEFLYFNRYDDDSAQSETVDKESISKDWNQSEIDDDDLQKEIVEIQNKIQLSEIEIGEEKAKIDEEYYNGDIDEEERDRKKDEVDKRLGLDKAMMQKEIDDRQNAIDSSQRKQEELHDGLRADKIVKGIFGSKNESLSTPSKNSLIRSFEDSYGRGIAGSIRSLSFDWNEAPWEISPGSKAPKWCKISVQFSPIHDLPMGLDKFGTPTAVPYPVGEVVRETYFPELHYNTRQRTSTQRSSQQQTSQDQSSPAVPSRQASEGGLPDANLPPLQESINPNAPPKIDLNSELNPNTKIS